MHNIGMGQQHVCNMYSLNSKINRMKQIDFVSKDSDQ